MPKQQKGWITADEAKARAARAHRKTSIQQARKGKAGAPAYRETASGCPLLIAFLGAWAFLLWRAVVRHSWGWSRGR